jgi:hypothetical protein
MLVIFVYYINILFPSYLDPGFSQGSSSLCTEHDVLVLWRLPFHLKCLQNVFLLSTSTRLQSVSAVKTSGPNLLRKLIGVYLVNHKRHINTACRPNVYVLNSSAGGIPGPEMVVLIKLYHLQVRIVLFPYYKLHKFYFIFYCCTVHVVSISPLLFQIMQFTTL